jgi:hypothetical protein
MSKNKVKSESNKKIIISCDEIEQFKSMLDNFGSNLSKVNENYKKIIDCK